MYRLYGTNSVIEAINNGRATKAYLINGYSNQKVLSALNDFRVPIVYKSRQELDKMSSGGVHQGVIIEAKEISPITLETLVKKYKEQKFGYLIILDELKDPHNLGAILRSCHAFGAEGVIYKSNNNVKINVTVEKVSSGAVNYVPICEVTNLSRAIEYLKKNDYRVVSLDGGSNMTIDDLPFDRKLAYVLGSEGDGISRLILKNSDYIAKIPMKTLGHIDSLNAATTGGIVAYVHSRKIKDLY